MNEGLGAEPAHVWVENLRIDPVLIHVLDTLIRVVSGGLVVCVGVGKLGRREAIVTRPDASVGVPSMTQVSTPSSCPMWGTRSFHFSGTREVRVSAGSVTCVSTSITLNSSKRSIAFPPVRILPLDGGRLFPDLGSGFGEEAVKVVQRPFGCRRYAPSATVSLDLRLIHPAGDKNCYRPSVAGSPSFGDAANGMRARAVSG